MKRALLAIFFFCIFSLGIYGQEEQYIQQFRELAKKVDENNQANLEVLQKCAELGQCVTEVQLRQLRERQLDFARECNAFYVQIMQQGIKIHQQPQGLEILSELRLKSMMKAARFRWIWNQLRAKGLAKEAEKDVARKWSLIDFRIGDEELCHKDTQRRVKDCIANIKAYKADIESLTGLKKEMEEASDTKRESVIVDPDVVSRLSKISDAMRMEYCIAREYIIEDPKGAEGLEQELDAIFVEVYRGSEREMLLLPQQN